MFVDVVIAAGWVALWIYWLAASLHTKAAQTPSRRLIGARVAVIVAVFALARSGIFGGHGSTHNPWTQGVGLALFLSGLALALWARIRLGRNWGTPMSQKVDPELVTTGPYRYVRHPIYSGLMLGMLGTAIAVSPFWAVAVVVLGAYFAYSAKVEERNMERLFPQRYPEYKRATKMLVPFVF
jgi:protein-S-isoprenylcysteine O-methyltransferase Ste14